jgi:hypothetical protein
VVVKFCDSISTLVVGVLNFVHFLTYMLDFRYDHLYKISELIFQMICTFVTVLET